jgi:hypothetical protein
MKRLNKTQQNELSAHIAMLADKKIEIEAAWERFELAHGELAEAIGEYNGALTNVIEWRDGIVNEMTDYQGERSDKWQEGDAGQQYQSWIDEWEGLELDEVEVPEIPDAPEFEHVEALENAPQEADSM